MDLSDPAHPSEAGAYVPKPTFTPDLRDERLFFPPEDTGGLLPTDTTKPGSTAPRWTDPVVQDGLVYVVDIDFGLYVLRYTGPHASEVRRAAFVEGNSSPSRYTAKAPAVTRPASAWPAIARSVAHGPSLTRSPYRLSDRHALRHSGFLCM